MNIDKVLEIVEKIRDRQEELAERNAGQHAEIIASVAQVREERAYDRGRSKLLGGIAGGLVGLLAALASVWAAKP